MDNKKYKIGIIGMGPIGQVLAVHFKQAGCEVAICDLDAEKLNLIRKNGIELMGKIEKKEYFKHVYHSIDDLLNHDFEILISAVKAYHVDSVLDHIKKGSSNNLFLLSAQNGIDIREKYLDQFSESQILRMVINFAGNLQAPNIVNITFFNPPNHVGSVNDTQPDIAKWVANCLSSVDLETNYGDSFDISDKLWAKTILNAALSPLCGITRLTMKEAMEYPDTLEIVEQIIYEAVEVAKAEDVKIPDNFVKLCIRYLKMAGNHFPSLAVDLINKNPTEIDFMNGKIVEYGRKHYIKTPLNLTFTNLVNAMSHKNCK
jgi:2-dehydropantoate 2-reductase